MRKIADIYEKMEHGGDILSYQPYYDGELVDFSSNINPLGPPKGLKEVLTEGFNALEAYPDIKYRKLKDSLSTYLNCPVENILVGNGAVEIIDSFTIPSQGVVVMTPSFAEYEMRAKVHGKKVKRVAYREDFSVDLPSLVDAIEPGDLLILGNPNNPTGLRIQKDELMEIYGHVKSRGAYLLLDEAFYEFCPEDYDSVELFKPYGYENMGIIRAATKFFALPGIRLGYGCCSKDKVKEIEKIQLPWSVNCFADKAGQIIFHDKSYIEESKAYIEVERRFVLKQLSKIQDIVPYPTHTNYILIELLEWSEDRVFNFFLKRGLLIRKCSSFSGLSGNYIRVAIKDRENNLRLVKAFNELRKGNFK